MGADTSRRRQAIPWPALGIATLLALAAYLGSELYLLDGEVGFPLDDSYIHLVFARSLARSEGLAFQGGALVTGSTAPLWTALLSLVFWLPGSPLLWAKVLGSLAHLGSVVGSFLLARELGVRRSLAMVGAIVVAFTSWLVWSALGAMEVSLFVTVGLAGMTLHLRERARPGRPALSLGLFGVATLLRPEGMLLTAAAVLDRVSPRQRTGEAFASERWGPQLTTLLRGLLLVALALLPVALFYRAVGGSWLPTTYDTKMSYGDGLSWPSRGYLTRVVGILFQAQPVAALLAPAGVIALMRRLGGPRDRGLLPALWLLGLPLAYAVLSGGRVVVGNFGRYYFPLFPILAVLAVLAIEELAREMPLRMTVGERGGRWWPAVAILLLAPSVFAWVQGAGRYSQSVLNVHDSDVRMARWIEANVPSTAVLAVNDIGAFGWILENPIVDLAGIATPEVHRYARAALHRGESAHAGILDFVRDARPDYLAVFPEWFGPVLSTGELVPLATLEVPDNITMGGDELVLYGTPWTRVPLRDGASSPSEPPP